MGRPSRRVAYPSLLKIAARKKQKKRKKRNSGEKGRKTACAYEMRNEVCGRGNDQRNVGKRETTGEALIRSPALRNQQLGGGTWRSILGEENDATRRRGESRPSEGRGKKGGGGVRGVMDAPCFSANTAVRVA